MTKISFWPGEQDVQTLLLTARLKRIWKAHRSDFLAAAQQVAGLELRQGIRVKVDLKDRRCNAGVQDQTAVRLSFKNGGLLEESALQITTHEILHRLLQQAGLSLRTIHPDAYYNMPYEKAVELVHIAFYPFYRMLLFKAFDPQLAAILWRLEGKDVRYPDSPTHLTGYDYADSLTPAQSKEFIRQFRNNPDYKKLARDFSAG